MAEVLSQSQIDALLNAARSGEMDLVSTSMDQYKNFKNYYLYSNIKFIK